MGRPKGGPPGPVRNPSGAPARERALSTTAVALGGDTASEARGPPSQRAVLPRCGLPPPGKRDPLGGREGSDPALVPRAFFGHPTAAHMGRTGTIRTRTVQPGWVAARLARVERLSRLGPRRSGTGGSLHDASGYPGQSVLHFRPRGALDRCREPGKRLVLATFPPLRPGNARSHARACPPLCRFHTRWRGRSDGDSIHGCAALAGVVSEWEREPICDLGIGNH